jgi:integrase
LRTRSPSYLTKNRLGIFIFQYRFPKAVQKILIPPKILFRRTLKTRDKRLAEQRARKWWVILDELERKYFDTPRMYAKAIVLLSEYQAVENLSWNEVEAYLSELDSYESDLLKKGIDHQNERRLIEENNRLKETLAILASRPISTIAQTSSSDTAHSKQNDPNNILLTEAIELFISYKHGHVQSSTTKNLEGRTRIFGKILLEHTKKDLRLTDISREHIKYYRETVPQLPAIRNGNLSNASIKALIKSPNTKLSALTVKLTFGVVGEFLEWLEKEIYPVEKGLRTLLSGWKPPKGSKSKKRMNFSDSQLKMMFESKEYKQGPIKLPSMFWAPLISLYTGARAGEILQLEFSDIEQVNDIWLFNINDEDDKKVKTKAGIRKVPIHSKLIELGFLDYLKARNKTEMIRVFPEEQRNKTGQFDSFSKRFATFKKNCGIQSDDTKMYDFHSFRHTIRTKLTESCIEESLIDSMVGHENKSASIGRTVYNHAELLPQKKAAIETVSYNIDFDKIKRWDTHAFLQLLRHPELKRAKLR